MKRIFKTLLFPFVGIASLVWFLIRVIPKPSRASYPCMRVAAPVASIFVTYVAGLFSSVYLFKKARVFFKESRYVLYAVTLSIGILAAFGTQIRQSEKALAFSQSLPDGPNEPMGTGTGIHPGRVAWIFNPDATNADFTNSKDDYWYEDKNADTEVIRTMLSHGLQMLTGEATDAAAWDALFKDFNQKHGKGNVGYTPGEKIVIKINFNGLGNSYTSRPPKNINTSPQMCYALLDQLIYVAGVAQADIGIGDSNFNFDNYHFNKCHSVFPDVKYWGDGNGRTKVTIPTEDPVLFASDGEFEDVLPQAFVDADYMINMPVFKKHHRAGISLACKNHFGTMAPFTGGAWHLHPSLPSPEATADATNGEYGVYRCFVDIMGHKDLGGKTVLYIIDGIWGSTNWGHPPVKWRMPPFNDDYPSSLFISQDPVAIESVCFDFLRYEFDENHPTEGVFVGDDKGPYPQYPGVDDYLHQAADSENWPDGITYDPEDDGTPLPSSMGAHEHWNNAVDKQYSRNLDQSTGIELLSNLNSSAVERTPSVSVNDFSVGPNYPNPFNPSTTITYRVDVPSDVTLVLYNSFGEKVRSLVHGFHGAGQYQAPWDGMLEDLNPAPSGIYYARMTVRNSSSVSSRSSKLLLCR
jgi:hypothetical protein